MTVDELLHRISSRELSEWMAYYRIEPFGQEARWLRTGVIASTIANVNRNEKKRSKPFEPSDFIPQFVKQAVTRKPWQHLLATARRSLNLKE